MTITAAPTPNGTTHMPPATPELRPPAGAPSSPPARATRRSPAGAFIGVLLVALGVLALAENIWQVPAGQLFGTFLFIGLGLAFLTARYATGVYGFAVPAGILLGFGAFVALQPTSLLPGDEGAWFFLLLAVGFAAIYPLGGQRRLVWPLYPAAGLAMFGLAILVMPHGLQLAEYLWLGNFWPIALVAIGAWLLARPFLPNVVGRILGVVVVAGLVGYLGLLSASFATYFEPAYVGPRPAIPAFLAPFVQTQTLAAPIADGDMLRISNTSGQVTVRPGASPEVRVQALTMAPANQARPETRLTPSAGIVTLQSTYPSGGGGNVDFLVDVPTGTRLEIHTSSGNVDVRGITAPVAISTSSGQARLHPMPGRLDGNIQTSSGEVRVYFAQGTSTSVEVHTSSGGIDVDAAVVRRLSGDARTFTGVTGEGTGRLAIGTSSGDVRLAVER